jgi:RNA polymerase sigma factor (sigma-70 family)
MNNKKNWDDYYMTNESILSLIKSWKKATPAMQPKIQSFIVEQLSYLVYSKVKGYKSKLFYNDLIQEGRMGLLKSIQDFDVKRGPNFFKLANWNIKSKIKNYIKFQQRFEKIITKQKKNNEFNIVLTPQECYEEKEGKKVIEKVLNKMSGIESKVVMMRFGVCGLKKHTLQQIGDIFSVSKQYVQQVELKAILKLKKNREINEFYNL